MYNMPFGAQGGMHARLLKSVALSCVVVFVVDRLPWWFLRSEWGWVPHNKTLAWNRLFALPFGEDHLLDIARVHWV